MSGDSSVKINLDLSPADIVKLKHAPITSSDVVSVTVNVSSETIEEDSLSII